jgi:hypothetical protein
MDEIIEQLEYLKNTLPFQFYCDQISIEEIGKREAAIISLRDNLPSGEADKFFSQWFSGKGYREISLDKPEAIQTFRRHLKNEGFWVGNYQRIKEDEYKNKSKINDGI